MTSIVFMEGHKRDVPPALSMAHQLKMVFDPTFSAFFLTDYIS